MAKKAGGSSRKLGRNKTKCLRYRSEGRRERNKLSKLVSIYRGTKRGQSKPYAEAVEEVTRLRRTIVGERGLGVKS